MPPSRVGTSTPYTGAAGNPITFSHTTSSDTELLLVSFHTSAAEIISSVTFDGIAMTSIHTTTASGSGQDGQTAVYGLILASAQKNKTANVVLTFTNSAAVTVIAHNWNGVDTDSLAAATNFISDDVNDSPTTTSVLSSGGSSGNILYANGGHRQSAATASWGTFTEIAEYAGGLYKFVDADHTSLPAGDTITWSTSDENVGVLIEIVAAPAAGKFTSLGPHGYPMPPYASFAGKAAAGGDDLIAQARSTSRFIHGRIWGRVN